MGVLGNLIGDAITALSTFGGGLIGSEFGPVGTFIGSNLGGQGGGYIGGKVKGLIPFARGGMIMRPRNNALRRVPSFCMGGMIRKPSKKRIKRTRTKK